MRHWPSAVALVLAVLLPLSSLAAQSPQALERFAGTWKLNAAKSRFSTRPLKTPTNTTVIMVAEGALVVTTEGTSQRGVKTSTAFTARFNGEDMPVKGATPAQTRAYRWIDDHAFEWVTKVNGKPTTTTSVRLSMDGKMQTLTTTGTSADGQPVKTVTVYEKQ